MMSILDKYVAGERNRWMYVVVVAFFTLFSGVVGAATTTPHRYNRLNQQQRQRQTQSNGNDIHFFTYRPKTNVADHAAIDLDQRDIEQLLSNIGSSSRASAIFNDAMNVYQNGGHSKSYASITLDSPIRYNTPKGSTVTGRSIHGEEITGLLNHHIDVTLSAPDSDTATFTSDNNVVQVLYSTINSLSEQNPHVQCQVGGSVEPVVNGCFSSMGSITIGLNEPISYTYDIDGDNRNARTIQQLSTNAATTMFQCDKSRTNGTIRGIVMDDILDVTIASSSTEAASLNTLNFACPYDDYMKYFQYYLDYNYADNWIMSAYHGAETSSSEHIRTDFGLYQEVGRANSILKGTVVMNIFMYVLRQMNVAIDICRSTCPSEGRCHVNYNSGSGSGDEFLQVRPWDQAVAYYTGSLQVENFIIYDDDDGATNAQDGDGPVTINIGDDDNFGDGYLFFAFANEQCSYFNTCGEHSNEAYGTAKVNHDIFHQFILGQQNLLNGACDSVKQNKERIVSLMTVPLVQGTLYYAHKIDIMNDDSEATESIGATYAAAILPLINSCDPNDAAIIFQNMQVRGDNYQVSVAEAGAANDDDNIRQTDYLAVRYALERNYACLGISCRDINGIIDPSPTAVNVDFLDYADPCEDDPQASRPVQDGNIIMDVVTGGSNSGSSTAHNNNNNNNHNNNHNNNNNNNNNRDHVDHGEHHHHSYSQQGLSTPMTIGLAVILFLAALFITLLSCFCWRVPSDMNTTADMTGDAMVNGDANNGEFS